MSDAGPRDLADRGGWPRLLAGFDRHTTGLGVSMAVGYGVLYYAFAILAPAIVAEFGWSRLFVFGSLSAAMAAGIVSSPVAGRLLDRFGGRLVLSAGTIVASVALALLSQAASRGQFLAALFAVEIASAFVFYEAGFAMLTQMHGMRARLPISAVTLIAGFSSTLFWPLTALLLDRLGWRGAYLVLAGVNLAVALPIHLALPRHRPSPREAVTADRPAAPPTGRGRNLIVATMAVAFAAGAFAITGVQAHFPRFFADAGYSLAAAAGFAALIGPLQVGARVLDVLFGQSRHPLVVGAVANGALGLGVAMLFALPLGPGAAIAFALFFGAGQGLANIVRGAVPLAIFGPAGYATLIGNLGAVRIALTAAAPVAVAFVADRHGDAAGIALILAAALVSLAALLALSAMTRR